MEGGLETVVVGIVKVNSEQIEDICKIINFDQRFIFLFRYDVENYVILLNDLIGW